MNEKDYSNFDNIDIFSVGLFNEKSIEVDFMQANGIKTLSDLFKKYDTNNIKYDIFGEKEYNSFIEVFEEYGYDWECSYHKFYFESDQQDEMAKKIDKLYVEQYMKGLIKLVRYNYLDEDDFPFEDLNEYNYSISDKVFFEDMIELGFNCDEICGIYDTFIDMTYDTDEGFRVDEIVDLYCNSYFVEESTIAKYIKIKSIIFATETKNRKIR